MPGFCKAQKESKITDKLPAYGSTDSLSEWETAELAPLPLQTHVAVVHRSIATSLLTAGAYAQAGIDRWIAAERAVARSIGAVRDPRELIVPNAFYVAAGGFGGSILANARGTLPARFLYPPAGLMAAFVYFYPQTAKNVAKRGLDAIYEPQKRTQDMERVDAEITRLVTLPGHWLDKATSTVQSAVNQLSDTIQKGFTGSK